MYLDIITNWCKNNITNFKNVKVVESSYQKQAYEISTEENNTYYLWANDNTLIKSVERQIISIKFLRNYGYNVPIISQKGNINLHSRKIEFMLTEKLPGLNYDQKNVNNQLFYTEMGKLLREIHNLYNFDRCGYMENINYPSWTVFLISQINLWLNTIKPYTTISQYELITNELSNIIQRIPEKGNYSFIHGDFYANNLLIAERENDNSIVGILDFEWSMIGQAEYDLRVLEFFIFPNNPELKVCFYKGYGQSFNETLTSYYCLIYQLELLHLNINSNSLNILDIKYNIEEFMNRLKEYSN